MLRAFLPTFPLACWRVRAREASNHVTSELAWLDAPDIWWMQGDAGLAARPGAELRLHGTNPLFPPSGLAQRLFQEAPAKIKFLGSVEDPVYHRFSNKWIAGRTGWRQGRGSAET